MIRISDAHCHLHQGKLDDFVELSRTSLNAIAPDEWLSAIEFARIHQTALSLGVHPWFADRVGDCDFSVLEDLLQKHSWLHVGECGLHKTTKNRITPDLEIQLEVLERQLQIAQQLDRPVVLHGVGYENELKQLVEKYPNKYLWHHYHKSKKWFVKHKQHWVGLGVFILHQSPTQIQQLLADLCIEQLLIESDYPYQMKSRADLGLVVGVLASYYGCEIEEFCLQLEQNWLKFHDF